MFRAKIKKLNTFNLTKTGIHNALTPGGLWDACTYVGGGAGLYYAYNLLHGHDIWDRLVGGMKDKAKFDSSLGTKPDPQVPGDRSKRGKTSVLTVTHDHGKRSVELDLVELVKAEDEALNLLHSRQSDLMSQKAIARAAGDSDDVEYFKGEILKLRALIKVRDDELGVKRAQRKLKATTD